jgi:hypothetical protein
VSRALVFITNIRSEISEWYSHHLFVLFHEVDTAWVEFKTEAEESLSKFSHEIL